MSPITQPQTDLSPDSTLVRLRPHHLLCLLTWQGCGYTPGFTAAFDLAMDLLKSGQARAKIVEGPDSLCAALCPDTTPDYHCRNDSVRERDRLALASLNQHLGTAWQIGDTLALVDLPLDDMRRLFQQGDLRAACEGCEWQGFCTDIAADGFTKTVAKGSASA